MRATPRRLHVELTLDGRDYDVIADGEEVADDRDRTIVELVRQSPGRTAQELLQSWPKEIPPPRLRAMTERLRRLGNRGVLTKEGRGNRWSAWRWRMGLSVKERG